MPRACSEGTSQVTLPEGLCQKYSQPCSLLKTATQPSGSSRARAAPSREGDDDTGLDVAESSAMGGACQVVCPEAWCQ